MKSEIKSDYKNDNTWVISLIEEQFIFDPAKTDEGIKMKNSLLEGFLKYGKRTLINLLKNFIHEWDKKNLEQKNILAKIALFIKVNLGRFLYGRE